MKGLLTLSVSTEVPFGYCHLASVGPNAMQMSFPGPSGSVIVVLPVLATSSSWYINAGIPVMFVPFHVIVVIDWPADKQKTEFLVQNRLKSTILTMLTVGYGALTTPSTQ